MIAFPKQYLYFLGTFAFPPKINGSKFTKKKKYTKTKVLKKSINHY